MEGYAKLSLYMGAFPDVAVFKRFSALNAQNILFLQAELESLEAELRRYAAEDEASSEGKRKYYSRNWDCLRESAENHATEGSNGKQWKTFLEIRGILKEYNAAILQQQALTNLDNPSKETMREINDWMESADRGSTRLLGQDRGIWSDSQLSELLVLKTMHKEDPLSNLINNHFLEWYFSNFGKGKQIRIPKPTLEAPHLANTVVKPTRPTHIFTRSLTTVLACLIPVASIAILHYMDTFAKKLGVIAALTATFSFSLAVMTNARVVDIFTATAAFAAVTVVFVGTDAISKTEKVVA